LEPRLEEAVAGTRAVFFVDASHFVLAPFLGFLWSVARVFLRAPSGRQRFNVLGALQAVTHQLLTVTNDTYITAESVCLLLEQVASAGGALPVTVVLDNASYQRCARVAACAARLGIELLFLPPYSPNLNLIERLWGFVKDARLYNTYYEKFPAFTAAIEACLAETQGRHKAALDTHLTLKFQSFKTSINSLG